MELHQKYGGNPDVDVSYQYLRYFAEDDAELDELYNSYKAGTLSTGALKQRCIAELQKFVGAFQEREKAVTNELIDQFMDPNYPRPY
ncbi:tryptophan--tRNA ligase [Dispira simplex]|nr:tryptophan--tRNA ligase [Dispira simplex]